MIGIITYYNPINYGGVFQAYAMQEIVKNCMPYEEVGIVEYCPEKVKNSYSLIKLTSWKAILISLYNLKVNFVRKKVFENFIRDNMTIISMAEAKNADQLVLGSDQIWNPNISGGFQPEFFGLIGAMKKQRICSYAASIGVSSLNVEEMKILSELIKNIQYVSVREKEAKMIIQQVTTKDVVVDIDPTLLVSRRVWDKLKKDPEVKREYILVYSLSGYDLTYKTAENIAKKYKVEIVDISLKNQKPFEKNRHNKKKQVSPEEFLGWINSAKAIVTDSFHGTVFSILFQKNFYTIPNKTKASRMVELMRDLKIESHLIYNESNLVFDDIDYALVGSLLKNKREKSRQHMLEILRINSDNINKGQE